MSLVTHQKWISNSLLKNEDLGERDLLTLVVPSNSHEAFNQWFGAWLVVTVAIIVAKITDIRFKSGALSGRIQIPT